MARITKEIKALISEYEGLRSEYEELEQLFDDCELRIHDVVSELKKLGLTDKQLEDRAIIDLPETPFGMVVTLRGTIRKWG